MEYTRTTKLIDSVDMKDLYELLRRVTDTLNGSKPSA